jgi:riboflavin synthase
MFTGIIQSVGSVESMSGGAGTKRLTIAAPEVGRALKKGDSVAVSGVCLTAVAISQAGFAADLAQETIARTTLTRLGPGAPVNLELPLASGAPLGGHIIQGHVDGIGSLVQLEPIRGQDDYWLRLTIPESLTRYVVEKGSIAVEGISLTVANIAGEEVGIAIIPHTYAATNLHALKPGDAVNIEVDILAKYAEKMGALRAQWTPLTVERLRKEGF